MANAHEPLASLLTAYLAADYRWEWRGQWCPLVIGQCAPEVSDAFPDAGQFGLLSAWNPYSVARQRQANQVADAALHAALIGSCKSLQPAFASARDRSWKEPGWLIVDVLQTELDALAHQFGQLGTLWWQRDQPIRLRMGTRQPATAPGHAFVDWLK